MQNGIPYWYFHRHGGSARRHDRAQRRSERRRRCRHPGAARVGCVVYPASELVAPGSSGTSRASASRSASWTARSASAWSGRRLSTAGFKAPVLDDIRAEIWLKLWGNLTFNPISSLAHSTLVDICQYPLRASSPRR
jgi:2-dehydropantoate 2-reductase